MAQKFSKVISVVTEKFENVRRMSQSMSIDFMQEHKYTLDCGHKVHEAVRIGTQSKGRMRCKSCAKACG
jgi:predicted SprT family Zn-dependent metalloprotease